MAELGDSGPTVGTVEVARDATGACVIKLCGEIDVSNVDSLLAEIEPLAETAPERVVFDLSALDFMDSSGIAVLLHVAAHAESVRLHEPSATMRRLIEATGLTNVLPLDR
jgi:anti-sigma B factor antagonist